MSDKSKSQYVMEGKDSTIGFFIGGAIAGAVSRTVAAPFERLKILYQVEDLSKRTKSGQKYTGILSSLKRIYIEEGIRGFFKGNGTNIVRIIPYSAVQFLSYEKYKMWLSQLSDHQLGIVGRLCCSGAAGITSVIVSYPLDVIRCRLSAQHEIVQYKGIFDAFQKIYRAEGIRGLYRGIFPTILGIGPYVAINFTTYERLKHFWVDHFEEIGVISKLFLGAVSGTFSQTITYPLDVVRRRMQMNGFGGHVEYQSTLDAWRKIYRKYGVRGFYKGLVPNYLKVIPVVSVNFIVYEYCKRILGLARNNKEI